MANLTLQQAAQRLSLKRKDLVTRMRRAGLLDHRCFPLHPERDAAHLSTHQSLYSHPSIGTMSNYSTRVHAGSLRWLADKLGIDQPMPEALPDRRLAGDS